jgi:hypothetical protein
MQQESFSWSQQDGGGLFYCLILSGVATPSPPPPNTNLQAVSLQLPNDDLYLGLLLFGCSVPGGPLLEGRMEQDGVPLHLHYAGGAHL